MKLLGAQVKISAYSDPREKRYSQVVLFYTALCLILTKSLELCFSTSSKHRWAPKNSIFQIIIVGCLYILLQLPLFKILITLEETLTKPQI